MSEPRCQWCGETEFMHALYLGKRYCHRAEFETAPEQPAGRDVWSVDEDYQLRRNGLAVWNEGGYVQLRKTEDADSLRAALTDRAELIRRAETAERELAEARYEREAAREKALAAIRRWRNLHPNQRAFALDALKTDGDSLGAIARGCAADILKALE